MVGKPHQGENGVTSQGPTCDVIVVAAGSGQRFGAALPKQYAPLGSRPVLRWSLDAFTQHPRIRHVLPVIHPDFTSTAQTLAAGLNIAAPVAGGATRQQSVLNGLEALSTNPPDWILIHDGARPAIASTLIDRVLEGLALGPAVVPVVPVADTLKRIDAHARISETVPRANLVRAQTPQGFHFGKILAAHRALKGQELTDDAAVFEKSGGTVLTVPGSEQNIKITTPDDLWRMEQSLLETRIGQGFDVHRFTDGDHVMLCGVAVPHTHKLLGHSDADVALHAATDAILGAFGAGDIGVHFPPTNAAYKDAASEKFLVHAMELLRKRGGQLTHLDITIICERPKVAPHSAAMIASIARMAGVEPSRISVKATTTEGLGFTGRREGIAAQAVATVRVLPL
ncbi:MAG: bifunctional 2-C-methyl-D-erythritol 4-phosphate cytidylyltransferase/2-C-methyl-D-erythritol 2,4-cyclodiphosphate synthase [Rhodospirillaceae bacterium]|nr:bifunctional 2-C-methyl-D-erythritol 4-phosphate cytidylyltransferase/2-C-methyl-D-erythritol 2,4-cyclodiphosphate synthase [Rhodospirillaceae bacterium]